MAIRLDDLNVCGGICGVCSFKIDKKMKHVVFCNMFFLFAYFVVLYEP